MAFVVIGLWMVGMFGPAPQQDGEWIGWIGWIGIVFFGLCEIVGAARMFDRDDQILVSERGLHWKRWSDATIPWTEIREVREAKVQRQRYLCVELAHPERYPASTYMGRFAGVNKLLGFGDIAINTAGTDKSFTELRDEVLAHWSHHQRG